MKQKVFLLGLFALISAIPVLAQSQMREDLWVSSTVEANLFSVSNIAFGSGGSIGYGDGGSIGLQVLYSNDWDLIQVLELNVLLRLYVIRTSNHSGLFAQIHGGPVLIFSNASVAVPAELGTISAGLTVGWRFIFGKYIFVEPAVRGGYPYTLGAAVSAGVRF